MTVRDATRRESPDGHVLYIEELRRHLGVGTDAGEGSSPPDAPKARLEVLLIGHDMHDDLKKMAKDGIDLQKFFEYSGCVDTQVLIEDSGSGMGKSLGCLTSRYDLAEPEFKGPLCPHIPAKLSFVGSHCAGNDGVVTLGSAVGQAFDPSLRISARADSADEKDRSGDWLEKPLRGINTNLILLAYDTESVENPRYKPFILNRTSEHGFAWLRLAEVALVPPGEHGKNWRPFIRARHWINHDFRQFQNKYFCVGNPMGFWRE